jgi:hypothetical protein
MREGIFTLAHYGETPIDSNAVNKPRFPLDDAVLIPHYPLTGHDGLGVPPDLPGASASGAFSKVKPDVWRATAIRPWEKPDRQPEGVRVHQ